MRRTKTGNGKAHGHRSALSPESPAQFEPDKRAHAVAKEGETPLTQMPQSFGCHRSKLLDVGNERLTDPAFSSGQVHRPEFNRRRKLIGPAAERACASACIRKAKEAQFRTRLAPDAACPRREACQAEPLL